MVSATRTNHPQPPGAQTHKHPAFLASHQTNPAYLLSNSKPLQGPPFFKTNGLPNIALSANPDGHSSSGIVNSA